MTTTALREPAERAAAEGLLDVAYASADSPFGALLLARTPQGLVRLGLPSQDVEEMLVDLAERISPRVLEAPAHSTRCGASSSSTSRAARRLRAADRLAAQPRLPAPRPAGDRPHPLRRDPHLHGPRRGAGNERAVRAAGSACSATRSRSSSPATAWCAATAPGLYAGGVEMKRPAGDGGCSGHLGGSSETRVCGWRALGPSGARTQGGRLEQRYLAD